MNVHRVFVDTNVLLSGLAFGGNEAALLRMAAADEVRLVISEAVLSEARDVIARKFPGPEGELNNLLSQVSWESVEYPNPEACADAAKLVRDPRDAPILASILVSKPDYALTGDKDLLTEEVRAVVPTCRCAEYLQQLLAED